MQPSPVLTIRGPDDAINCLLCLGERVATGSISGNLRVWDLKTKRLATPTVLAHQQSILSLGLIGINLISNSRDGDVKVWSMVDLQSSPLVTFLTGAYHFCNLSSDRSDENPDSYNLVTPSSDLSEIILWDLRTSVRSAVFRLPAECGMTTSLLYHSNLSRSAQQSGIHQDSSSASSSVVIVGSEDGSITLFDLRNTSCPVSSLKVHDNQPVLSIDASSSRGLLLSGAADNRLSLSTLSAESAGSVQAHTNFELPVAGTSCARFRSDGRMCVSSHWDGSARLFEVSKKQPLKPLGLLRHHREPVTSIDFERVRSSEHFGKFCMASKDGSISQWDLFADKIR